jgi:hypothetical protein
MRGSRQRISPPCAPTPLYVREPDSDSNLTSTSHLNLFDPMPLYVKALHCHLHAFSEAID